MNTFLLCIQGATAAYLIVGVTILKASDNLASKIIFKAIPMVLGLALAFGVYEQVRT
jgi:hypothetical protein